MSDIEAAAPPPEDPEKGLADWLIHSKWGRLTVPAAAAVYALQACVSPQSGTTERQTFGVVFALSASHATTDGFRATGQVFEQRIITDPRRPNALPEHQATYKVGQVTLVLAGCKTQTDPAPVADPAVVVELGPGEPIENTPVHAPVHTAFGGKTYDCSVFEIQRP